MMRLLVITNRYPEDADDSASPFVPHFVNALISCGVEVDVLTPSYSPEFNPNTADAGTGLCADDGRVRVFRFESGATEPVGSWKLGNPLSWVRLTRFMRHGQRKGARLCAENSYDHILALWALPSGHFAQSLSRRFQIPYSVWCLGSDIYTWANRPLIRDRIAGILTGAAHVFADGADMCRRIKSWLHIDSEFLPSFRPLQGLEGVELPSLTDSPRFLYLGRLHRDKGIFELLMAFAHLRMALPDARLRYVGDGPQRRELARLAAEMHLYHPDERERGSVTIDGPVSHDGVVTALRECDWVVIPTQSDSIPLVFTEAVQAMRPVIGTDVGDLGAMIRQYGMGHVSPSADSKDLARTMIRAVHDPVFDLQGRADLLDLFDPRRVARNFCAHVFTSEPRPPSSLPGKTIAQMIRV